MRLARNYKTGLSCCFSFIDVHNDDLHKFLEPPETLYIDSRPLFFQLANVNQSEKSKNSLKRVYLKNLPIKNPIQNLAFYFSTFGEIQSAYQIKNAQNKLQSYGFVDFKTIADAQKLLAMEKLEINGRVIKLVPYAEKKKRGAKEDRDLSSNANSDYNESSGHSTGPDYNIRDNSGTRSAFLEFNPGKETIVKLPKSKKIQKHNPFSKKSQQGSFQPQNSLFSQLQPISHKQVHQQ